MVAAIGLAFEIAKLAALVHEGFRGNPPAERADDVALFAIQDEIGLFTVAVRVAVGGRRRAQNKKEAWAGRA